MRIGRRRYLHAKFKVGLLWVTALVGQNARAASLTMPFHGCTFYKPRLVLESFAGASPFAGCAEFSAVNGRNGCRKVKGVCPCAFSPIRPGSFTESDRSISQSDRSAATHFNLLMNQA